MPSLLLRNVGDQGRVTVHSGLAPGEVSISPLIVDSTRVDVAEEDRLVLRYATRVAGKPGGSVVLSLYAAPLFRALARMEPIAGVRMVLVDRAGNYLVAPGAARPRRARRNPHLLREHPEAFAALAARGQNVARIGDGGLVGSPTGPRLDGALLAWLLVAIAPTAALERGAHSLRSEALGVGALLLPTILAIGIVDSSSCARRSRGSAPRRSARPSASSSSRSAWRR